MEILTEKQALINIRNDFVQQRANAAINASLFNRQALASPIPDPTTDQKVVQFNTLVKNLTDGIELVDELLITAEVKTEKNEGDKTN